MTTLKRTHDASTHGASGHWTLFFVALGVALVAGMAAQLAMGAFGTAGPYTMALGMHSPMPVSWAWSLGMGLSMFSMLAFWSLILAGAIVLAQRLPSGDMTANQRSGDVSADSPRRGYAAHDDTRVDYERTP
jgi:hypothetical protein